MINLEHELEAGTPIEDDKQEKEEMSEDPINASTPTTLMIFEKNNSMSPIAKDYVPKGYR